MICAEIVKGKRRLKENKMVCDKRAGLCTAKTQIYSHLPYWGGSGGEMK